MLIYKSYGVLAREKQPVYTFDRPASEIYDAISVLVPDGWSIGENAAGETLVESPDGITYRGKEILSNWGESPAFRWYDGHADRHVILEVIS